jgi:hypothetical protein
LVINTTLAPEHLQKATGGYFRAEMASGFSNATAGIAQNHPSPLNCHSTLGLKTNGKHEKQWSSKSQGDLRVGVYDAIAEIAQNHPHLH